MTVLLAALAALALAACGERQEPTAAAPQTERIDLMLDYFPNADHAGIYAGIDRGDFARAGLEVQPRTPSDPAAPLKLLASNRVDLAISYEPELLLARDKGARLVAVGALVQRPLTSIISVGDDKIRDPAQLRGKRVGTAGIPYQDAYLKAILDRAGVPRDTVRKIDVGFNLTPAMLSERVDATLGSFWNYEGVELARRGRKPSIIRVDEVGVPTYNELIVVAREDDARRRGPMIRRFMTALAAGHRALRRDPMVGVRPLLQANRDLERGLQLAAVRATMPVFFPADGDRPFGWQDPEDWAEYARWMTRNDLISSPAVVEGAFTNEYLPGEGV